MKRIIVLSLLLISCFLFSNEELLHNRLIKLYKNSDHKWKIAKQYYSMALYYSKKGAADKAFIMLKRASDTGFNNFSPVYSSPDFSSLRKLKYWKSFTTIGKAPKNCSLRGYYLTHSNKKIRLYINSLKILLGERLKNNLWLYRKYKERVIIKEYTFGGKPRFRVFYRKHKVKKEFVAFKTMEFSPAGELIYEYFENTKVGRYFFYYKDKIWGVEYFEKFGKISWHLIE